MLMMREDISRKELLLDCSATAYMFDKWHYFTSYTSTQAAGQYNTVGDHNYVLITNYKSVKF